MILNNTPIRTSKNFKANDIEIDDIKMPEELEEFSNRTIYINSEKKILLVEEGSNSIEKQENLYEDANLLVTKNVKDDFKLKYGISKDLLLTDKINQTLRILAKENSINSDVNIEFLFDDNNKNLFDNIEIYAEKNSNINVSISYIPQIVNDEFAGIDKTEEISTLNSVLEKDNEYFHNGIIKVCGLENSVINLTVINLLNNTSNSFINYDNKLLDNATLNYTIVDFGGKNSISNYYSDLFGKTSSNNLSTIYLGNENQLFDLNYIAHCRGEKSNVDIEVQGALKDEAIKHFKGTIDFKKGCKKASGNENENCLLLSDKAKSLALPMLLCSEEDVEGNHSSSSGKAGKQELFYLMSRGFSERDAMKLLVRARFNKILEGIRDADIKNLILSAIESKL